MIVAFTLALLVAVAGEPAQTVPVVIWTFDAKG